MVSNTCSGTETHSTDTLANETIHLNRRVANYFREYAYYTQTHNILQRFDPTHPSRSYSAWLPIGQSTGLTAIAAQLQHKDGRHSLPNWLQSTNAPGHNTAGQGTQPVPWAAKVLVRWRCPVGPSLATIFRSVCYPFRCSLHNTKLVAYQLRFLAHSLDKGCHHLRELSLLHCAVADGGIRSFLETCGRESFSTLTVLNLTNNNISK